MAYQKTVTIKTIAQKSGCSLSAVSKALNNYPDISEETRTKIVNIAIELGYTPNMNARCLAKKTSNTVGFIVRDISTIYGELFKPLTIEARKHNLQIVIADSNRDVETEEQYIKSMLASQVRSIIISPVDKDYKRIERIVDGRVPVIFLGNSVIDETENYVATDNRKGTDLALQYLHKLGHRNIAIICDSKQSNSTKTKISEYKKFSFEHGISPEVFIESDDSKSLIQSGYDQAMEMLKTKKKFTAIFAVKDPVAIGVMKALKDKNIRVPEDMSIVGFDNSEISKNPMINLTTIGQPKQVVVEELLKMIVTLSDENCNNPQHFVSTPFLVERGSCTKLK